MSSDGISSSRPGRRRIQVFRLIILLLIAFCVSAILVLLFFTSSAVSR